MPPYHYNCVFCSRAHAFVSRRCTLDTGVSWEENSKRCDMCVYNLAPCPEGIALGRAETERFPMELATKNMDAFLLIATLAHY